jgi:hypothetical protein
MRKQLMDGLRKAGQRLSDFDAAYAERASRDMGSVEKHPLRHLLGASPLSQIGDVQADTLAERILGEGLVLGTKATNIGYRYGLPAAGVTLAGKGLFDITQGLYAMAADTPVFGGPEDGAQPGQLPLS